MPDLKNLMKGILLAATLFVYCGVSSEAEKETGEHAISGEHAIVREHPRLLGSKQELKRLAKERYEAYARVVDVARNLEPGDEMVIDDHMKMISMALVFVIEDDLEIGRQAVERAMKYINAPIRVGHTTFGHDLARCAIVYDLCRPVWSEQEREKFFDYIGKTVDANVNSEAHVFHNGWYVRRKYWKPSGTTIRRVQRPRWKCPAAGVVSPKGTMSTTGPTSGCFSAMSPTGFRAGTSSPSLRGSSATGRWPACLKPIPG